MQMEIPRRQMWMERQWLAALKLWRDDVAANPGCSFLTELHQLQPSATRILQKERLVQCRVKSSACPWLQPGVIQLSSAPQHSLCIHLLLLLQLIRNQRPGELGLPQNMPTVLKVLFVVFPCPQTTNINVTSRWVPAGTRFKSSNYISFNSIYLIYPGTTCNNSHNIGQKTNAQANVCTLFLLALTRARRVLQWRRRWLSDGEWLLSAVPGSRAAEELVCGARRDNFLPFLLSFAKEI